MCVVLCLCVRSQKEKQLELSTPNFVHIYSLAGTRYTLTLRSHGYEVCCWHGYSCRYDCLCLQVSILVFFLFFFFRVWTGVSNSSIVSMPKRSCVDNAAQTISNFFRRKRQRVETDHTDNDGVLKFWAPFAVNSHFNHW